MESTRDVVRSTTENNGEASVVRSNIAPTPPPISLAPPPPQNYVPPPPGFSSGPVKKKRGRPRKYGHDGAPVALSPNPISSAAPTTSHVIDFSASEKRNKVKPPTTTTTSSSFVKTKHQLENLGEWTPPSSTGANFTPHIITVNAGEDVTNKIISFSQRGSLAICVLCANGAVSSVTLSQPDSSGGTLTYEGRFEILSLSGSFMPSDSDGTRSRTGGMTVSLASPEGRVVGGGVAGLLVAATPIQVIVGSFNQQNQIPKNNQNNNFTPSPIPASFNAPDHRNIRPASSSSLHISTWTPPLATDPRHKPSHDINIPLT